MADQGQQDGALSLAAHPRASAQIARAKGWGGLAGLGIAAYASMGAGAPMFDVGVRALAGGVAGYVIVWAIAVAAWRQLVVAEIRTAHARLEAARREAAEASQP